MATDPAGVPEVVATLRAAARRARAGGAPDTAADLLNRALAEPPTEDEKPHVLYELGTAEHALGRPTARDHLLAAAMATDDPLLRARALVTLAVNTQPDPARQRAQLGLYEQAARDVLPLDRELALQLYGARLGALLFNPDLPTRFEDEAAGYTDLPAETPAECLLVSFAARKLVADGVDVRGVGAIAERAAAHPGTPTSGFRFLPLNVTFCLLEAERYEVAERMLTRALRHAERGGSPIDVAGASWMRGLVRHACGDLRGAEADGWAAMESFPPGARARTVTWATTLVQPLTDAGRHDEAETILIEYDLDGELPPNLPMHLLLLARARLRVAIGHLEAARVDLEELLRRSLRFRRLSPLITYEAPIALVPVRLALGDVDGARELADRTLQAASRAGARRAVGGALRVGGLAHGGAAGLDLLRRAVDTLRASPALLWRAEALVDLGAALRQHGRATEAGTSLREGMDIAHRCGATPMADRAATELRATGARPRRRVSTGIDALTPSERRVAELAVTGMTNKQIAQALFVTLRTVELHLSNTYSKLSITSRRDLTRAFAPSEPSGLPGR
jgi:DNA-binding CsgD family transcriptional regulator